MAREPLIDPRYADLPIAVQAQTTPESFNWLTDGEKMRFQETMTEPPVHEIEDDAE